MSILTALMDDHDHRIDTTTAARDQPILEARCACFRRWWASNRERCRWDPARRVWTGE